MRAAFGLICALGVALSSCAPADAGEFYAQPERGQGLGADGKRTFPRITDFEESVTASRVTDVYALPTYGTTDRRDVVTVTGGGTVTAADGELSVATSAAANDTAQLDTVDRSAYIPGSQGQVGIGVRVPTLPADDQVGRWGLYDDANGFGWAVDADGAYLFYRSDSTETEIRLEDANIDPLDGSGPSSRTLDMTDGHVYHIDFVWYGYGAIVWSVMLDRPDGSSRVYPVHVYNPDGVLSIEDPNQAIRIDVENGATGGAFDLRVGGRQFSQYRGDVRRQARDLHQPVYDVTLSAEPDWTPLICARRKSTVNSRPNSIRSWLVGYSLLASANLETRMTVDDSVTGGTWGAPTGVDAGETSIETNTSMTSVTPGDVVHRGLLSSATGTSKEGLARSEERDDMPVTLAACLWARPFSGTPTVTAAIMDWEEQW